MHGFEDLCVGCFRDRSAGSVCDSCGFDEGAQRPGLFLPFRTVLNEQYVIGRELGSPGGFGITYLAWDRYLSERVAIKEYLPRKHAGRDADRISVRPHSEADAEHFKFGVEAFSAEAQTLARFRHENIVRVRTFLESNATAYMIMDHYSGTTLEKHLGRQGGRVGEDEALRLMAPILEALTSEVHAQKYLHRDISPQNIYLASFGSETRPMLLDFGAARQALGDRSQSLSVILKPGYAPYEQYYQNGKQGPWTDVYACAATLYRAVTGEVPAPAVDRLRDDPLVAPRKLAPELSKRFCDALAWGLGVERNQRPQTVAEFRERLFDRPPGPPPDVPQVAPAKMAVLRPLDGELAGERVPLEETLIIGRDATTSHLVLKRSDLSRQHCALSFDAGRSRFELEDLDSANGTFVERGDDAYQLKPGQSVFLAAGESFHLVDRKNRFEVDLVAAEQPPAPADSGTPAAEAGEPPAGPEPATGPKPKVFARVAWFLAALAALAVALLALAWKLGI